MVYAHKNITDRDLEILYSLWQLQAIRAIDIADVWFNGGEHGLKRMQRLAGRGYVDRSFTIASNGRKNQSVYNITDIGIDVLYERGYIEMKRRARDLKLNGYRMVERIELSKICINLAQEGWSFTGSRDSKLDLRLATNEPIECTLTPPDEGIYQVYQMREDIRDDTCKRLILSLSENENGTLLFYNTPHPSIKTDGISKLLSRINKEYVTIKEFCLIPISEIVSGNKKVNMAYEMLRNSSREKVVKYLEGKYPLVKNITNRYAIGDLQVEDETGEYLVCNYLRRDQSALKLLSDSLTKREHASTKQKAIILTWQGFVGEVEEKLNNVEPGRDFIKIVPLLSKDIDELYTTTLPKQTTV